MTGNNAVATPAIVEGRILDLQSLRDARGGKTSDVSTAEAAFKRVAKKEMRIDFLVDYMSAPGRRDYEVSDAKGADLRAEIKAEYDDLIAKLELQEALKKLNLY